MGSSGVQVGADPRPADFVAVQSTRKDGLVLGPRGWYKPAAEFQSPGQMGDWDLDATMEVEN